MTSRFVAISLVTTLMAFDGMAQREENDDMYFNSKDREKSKLAASEISSVNLTSKKNKRIEPELYDEEKVNPTDSYSARSVNPEYTSRSNAELASEYEQDYYMEGSAQNTYDAYSSGNYNSSSFNNGYNNGWYGSSAWDNRYSPYYGYCNPWMSPYYSGGSGWTLSFNYTWENNWNTGWNYGMSSGWGNSYYSPYSYYPSYYSPYYSNWGYPNYYSGTSEYSRPNYGKRPSRHSAVVIPSNRSNQRVTHSISRDRSSDEYYVKPSRRTSTTESESNRYNQYERPTPNERTRTRESSNTRESRTTYTSPIRSSSSGSTPSKSSVNSSGSRRGRD